MNDAVWSAQEARPLHRIARNVATRYLLVAAELIVGLITLPFNLRHLGPDAYGLWMLTAGLTIHFSILDLGYGGAMVKFVAQYRAHRNARALNEIASTIFVLFTSIGLAAYLLVIGLAFNLEHLFNISAAQSEIGKWILLIVGVNVTFNFAFSVFGGVSSGFQRYDINNLVGMCTSIIVGLVNIGMLLMGFGVVALVAATTVVRLAMYFVYRRNAYRVFPALQISPSLFRRARLREITGFSVYSSMIDWAHKLNYEVDAIVIGVFLGAAPVAVWAVASRVIAATQRLTNQGNSVLFPVVVESDATNKQGRLQTVLLEGTRLTLATVAPIAVLLIVLADPLVRAWVGPEMLGAVPIIQILAFAVTLRVATATATTVLKGAGRVRYLAMVNLSAGVVNVALSAVLVQSYGLVGVAVGTLIPVAISSMFIIFPAACHRVGLPVARALRYSIWPAAWPAVAVGLVLSAVYRLTAPTAGLALAEAAAAGLLYVALFVVAVGRRDRANYTARIWELAT